MERGLLPGRGALTERRARAPFRRFGLEECRGLPRPHGLGLGAGGSWSWNGRRPGELREDRGRGIRRRGLSGRGRDRGGLPLRPVCGRLANARLVVESSGSSAGFPAGAIRTPRLLRT